MLEILIAGSLLFCLVMLSPLIGRWIYHALGEVFVDDDDTLSFDMEIVLGSTSAIATLVLLATIFFMIMESLP